MRSTEVSSVARCTRANQAQAKYNTVTPAAHTARPTAGRAWLEKQGADNREQSPRRFCAFAREMHLVLLART
jgi:hypothetical protein